MIRVKNISEYKYKHRVGVKCLISFYDQPTSGKAYVLVGLVCLSSTSPDKNPSQYRALVSAPFTHRHFQIGSTLKSLAQGPQTFHTFSTLYNWFTRKPIR